MKKCYSLCYLLLFFFSVLSCQPKDKFGWNAGLSAPKNYASGAPFVEYFYKGKSVAGASSGTGADQGWGITSGGYTGGDIYKDVPDSVSVHWVCSVDNLLYKGGFKLPREKILNFFKEKRAIPYNLWFKWKNNDQLFEARIIFTKDEKYYRAVYKAESRSTFPEDYREEETFAVFQQIDKNKPSELLIKINHENNNLKVYLKQDNKEHQISDFTFKIFNI